MTTQILMPKLGLTMERGTVTKWFKKMGDAVAEGEPVAEIETDKLTNEVEAPTTGVLLEILVAEGEDAEVLAPIGVIGEADESV